MLNKLVVNKKKISLLLTIIIIVCFAAAALLFFQIDMKSFKENKYQYDVNEEKSFAVEEIKKINIDSFSSDINIIEYDDNKVKVHVYGKLYAKQQDEKTPLIELNNGTLDINENRHSRLHIGINFNIGELFNENEMQIDIFMPKGYGESLKIDTSSGTVKSDSLILKELYINTFSGEIVLKDVTANEVDFETSSGEIRGEIINSEELNIKTFSGSSKFKSINADKVFFDTSSGDVSLGKVETNKIEGSTFSGKIEAEEINAENANFDSSAGNISIDKSTIKKVICETFSGEIEFSNATIIDADIDSSSGSVTLGLVKGSEFALVAESSSGDISCDFPVITTKKQEEHEIKGVVGKDTGKISIETFSGDIEINEVEVNS